MPDDETYYSGYNTVYGFENGITINTYSTKNAWSVSHVTVAECKIGIELHAGSTATEFNTKLSYAFVTPIARPSCTECYQSST